MILLGNRGALGVGMVGRLRQEERGKFERTAWDLAGPEGLVAGESKPNSRKRLKIQPTIWSTPT
jgi:hypothetical protein